MLIDETVFRYFVACFGGMVSIGDFFHRRFNDFKGSIENAGNKIIDLASITPGCENGS
ncbi:hypothetical protein [Bifidobacterium aquikefiri]|nr:hypothetical protein [Bifidobacterium aquikefiri]